MFVLSAISSGWLLLRDRKIHYIQCINKYRDQFPQDQPKEGCGHMLLHSARRTMTKGCTVEPHCSGYHTYCSVSLSQGLLMYYRGLVSIGKCPFNYVYVDLRLSKEKVAHLVAPRCQSLGPGRCR